MLLLHSSDLGFRGRLFGPIRSSHRETKASAEEGLEKCCTVPSALTWLNGQSWTRATAIPALPFLPGALGSKALARAQLDRIDVLRGERRREAKAESRLGLHFPGTSSTLSVAIK